MKNKTTKQIEDNNISDIEESILAINDQLRLLFIEQNKLQRALKSQQQRESTPRVGPTRNKGNTPKIGDRVRVNSKHKNRQGCIGTVTGLRGKTQVIVTSSSEAEAFSVWKHNITVIKRA